MHRSVCGRHGGSGQTVIGIVSDLSFRYEITEFMRAREFAVGECNARGNRCLAFFKSADTSALDAFEIFGAGYYEYICQEGGCCKVSEILGMSRVRHWQ